MPFLRLTRDRRGFENTFLMHADHPGDRPRLLYWYRTAPGIALGRPPLDEDAIRTIEEQHPHIDFDWPAILALSEVMTPEEEAPAPSPARKKRRPAPGGGQPDQRRPDEPAVESTGAPAQPELTGESAELDGEAAGDTEVEEMRPARHHVHGLLEELVGREIATRLRARHSEMQARIHEQPVDQALRDHWLRRAESLDPDLWVTPDAILDGVRNADRLFDQLRAELTPKKESGEV